jgi:hypothetical protein
MNVKTFFVILLCIFVGVLGAMLVWTLLVKNQVTAAVSSATASNPLLAAFGSL